VLYAVLKPIAVLLMRLWFRLEVRGAEHVPAAGPVLLVSNHNSMLDPPLIGGAAPRPLCFMAKAELFRIPLFGSLIRSLNARPVRREGSSAGALRDALATLQAGRALLVFPEGTRGAEGEIRPGKPGAGMLAVASGAPVVPVYISGSGLALPRGRALPRPVKIAVRFGPALCFAAGDGEVRRDRYRKATEEIIRAIARLRDEAGAEAGARGRAAGAHVRGRVSG
jgi:1-acyl-sn-glycerol-3-phosphate acyltransferase